MYYVYILKTVTAPTKRYIGFTADLRSRLRDHNDGKNASTAGLRPWRLHLYMAFADKKQALSFEKYLKSGSGHAFAKRRLW